MFFLLQRFQCRCEVFYRQHPRQPQITSNRCTGLIQTSSEKWDDILYMHIHLRDVQWHQSFWMSIEHPFSSFIRRTANKIFDVLTTSLKTVLQTYIAQSFRCPWNVHKVCTLDVHSMPRILFKLRNLRVIWDHAVKAVSSIMLLSWTRLVSVLNAESSLR